VAQKEEHQITKHINQTTTNRPWWCCANRPHHHIHICQPPPSGSSLSKLPALSCTTSKHHQSQCLLRMPDFLEPVSTTAAIPKTTSSSMTMAITTAQKISLQYQLYYHWCPSWTLSLHALLKRQSLLAAAVVVGRWCRQSSIEISSEIPDGTDPETKKTQQSTSPTCMAALPTRPV
jgi:hypothetical protein